MLHCIHKATNTQNKDLKMRTINSMRDLQGEVSDCGLFDPTLYADNWVELVAERYLELLRNKYSFSWGDKVPELDSDDEFWDLFKEFEL